jgi:hypothetical protein
MKEKKVKKTPRELKLLRIAKAIRENDERSSAYRHFLISQQTLSRDGSKPDTNTQLQQ